MPEEISYPLARSLARTRSIEQLNQDVADLQEAALTSGVRTLNVMGMSLEMDSKTALNALATVEEAIRIQAELDPSVADVNLDAISPLGRPIDWSYRRME